MCVDPSQPIFGIRDWCGHWAVAAPQRPDAAVTFAGCVKFAYSELDGE
jgi:hypothetical protein